MTSKLIEKASEKKQTKINLKRKIKSQNKQGKQQA